MDYDQGILAVPRRLFSQNYVDGGCEGEPPKNTTTDDTLGCYATNYLILVIGVLAACAFVRARERLERAGASGVERGLAAAYAAFFALTGLGYGAAGVLHHKFALAAPGYWAAAYVVVLLGNAGLCGVGALLTRGDAPSTKWKLGVAATVLVNVAVILLVAATQNMLACGVFTAVTLLVMIGVWGKHAMRPCGCGEAAGLDLARACCKGARVCVAGAVKVAGGVVMIGGMAVQVALADVCGDPGYEDCWEDCPLPDPMEFNHNALFHALYAAGLLALAVGVLCDTADSWTATEKPKDAAKELERV